MNREEAIQRIREAGFDAFARDWWMGETVGCGRIVDERDGAKKHAILIYLFPTQAGWGVQVPGLLGVTDYSQKMTLDDATELAIGILKSPFLPIAAKDLEVTLAKSVGGEGSWIEHKPTGIRRTLFIPVDGTRRVFLTRDQALQEIVFEIAVLKSTRTQQVDGGEGG